MSGGLVHGEWRITYPGTEYTFGTPLTPVWNRTTPDVGDVDIRVADVDRPRQDGRMFGVDYRGGKTITFELGVRGQTAEDARVQTAILSEVWRADVIRKNPGAVAELRTMYDGRERVAYGRPRRFAPNYSDATVNQFVSVVADFAMADDLFYSVINDSVNFGLVPVLGGGFTFPLTFPMSTTASSNRAQGIQVVSSMPVWPIITVRGPIINPVVNIGPDIVFDIRLTLEYDETVTIDTRPWARYAVRNGVTNVSGAIRGTRLAQASLSAGQYSVGLKGMDNTGTSSVNVAWNRSTFPGL